MKSEYGPTLGRMLAPRWHAAPRPVRAAVIAAGVLLLAAAVAAFLALRPATFSHGGAMPFEFQYKGLRRVASDPGGYVKLEGRYASGAIKYSYAVEPLRIGPYTGVPTGALAVYASGYIRHRRAGVAGFQLAGEGKTRVNGVPGYQVLYTGEVEGHPVYGRDVLLLPERPGAREGVEIVMLTAPKASSEVRAPSEVASAGALLRPLKTFTFG